MKMAAGKTEGMTNDCLLCLGSRLFRVLKVETSPSAQNKEHRQTANSRRPCASLLFLHAIKAMSSTGQN